MDEYRDDLFVEYFVTPARIKSFFGRCLKYRRDKGLGEREDLKEAAAGKKSISPTEKCYGFLTTKNQHAAECKNRGLEYAKSASMESLARMLRRHDSDLAAIGAATDVGMPAAPATAYRGIDTVEGLRLAVRSRDLIVPDLAALSAAEIVKVLKLHDHDLSDGHGDGGAEEHMDADYAFVEGTDRALDSRAEDEEGADTHDETDDGGNREDDAECDPYDDDECAAGLMSSLLDDDSLAQVEGDLIQDDRDE